jgi:HSP20 family protein
MATPTSLIRSLSRDMDRLFSEFGGRPRWNLPSLLTDEGGDVRWVPDIEVERKNGALVVKADLPGLKKEEVTVRVENDRLTIEGERKQETEEKREGYYHSERSYGHFCRMIALPEGAKTDEAKAAFKDGVLEVTVPVAAAEVPAARQLAIG